MADLFEAHVNSTLTRSLPECWVAHQVLQSCGLPVPAMEVPYEDFQDYDVLGMNKFGAHAMQLVDEGDIVCVYHRHDCLGSASLHQFGFVTAVRCGVDGEGHSLHITVTMLDRSRTEEMSQDTWADDVPDSTGRTRVQQPAVVRSQSRVNRQIPHDVLHFNHKLQEQQQADQHVKTQAVRNHRNSLAEQLRNVIGRAEDITNFCGENYGVEF